MASVCTLCGTLVSEGTWAERDRPAAAGEGRRVRQRGRLRRAAVLNQVLVHAGLRLDDWQGAAYVLRDRKGRQAVVADLTGLWAAAEAMLGRPLDPLDPGLIAVLERSAA